MKSNVVSKLLIFFTFLWMVVSPSFVFADWQATLSEQFDYVETFDNLADFTGTSGSGDVRSGSMPTTLDGKETNWDYYSMWTTPDLTKKWIGDQGRNNWSGNKAMALDYGGSDGVNGPSRFGYYIGEGDPARGYTDVYAFYMIKIPKSFYPTSGDSFNYFGYLKTFEIASGFRDVFSWGTPEQQALTDGSAQVDSVYGLNFTVFNHKDCNYMQCTESIYGDNLSTSINSYVSGTGSDYHYTASVEGYEFRDAAPGDLIREDKWYGVEYRIKQSSPHGAANGIIQTWIYDESGNVVGEQSLTLETFRDISVPLNHAFNKFVIGGNRSGFDAAPGGTFYVDDFIVNNKRIGLSYFALLQNGGVGNPVIAPPSQLNIVTNAQ